MQDKANGALPYPIVDSGQTQCYDAGAEIAAPALGANFYGQDAQYKGNEPSYTKSADGLTVMDNVTGLVWQQSPDTNGDGAINVADKMMAGYVGLAIVRSLPEDLLAGVRLPGNGRFGTLVMVLAGEAIGVALALVYLALPQAG